MYTKKGKTSELPAKTCAAEKDVYTAYMGYSAELNTLLGLPREFDPGQLSVGVRYTITRPRERAFPLHIALLVVDSEWKFYGYAVAHSIRVYDQKTDIEFEMLSLFTPQEQALYSEKFIDAAKKTGEIR